MEHTFTLTGAQLLLVRFSLIDEKNAYRETLSRMEDGTPEFENIQRYLIDIIALEDAIQAQIDAKR